METIKYIVLVVRFEIISTYLLNGESLSLPLLITKMGAKINAHIQLLKDDI